MSNGSRVLCVDDDAKVLAAPRRTCEVTDGARRRSGDRSDQLGSAICCRRLRLHLSDVFNISRPGEHLLIQTASKAPSVCQIAIGA